MLRAARSYITIYSLLHQAIIVRAVQAFAVVVELARRSALNAHYPPHSLLDAAMQLRARVGLPILREAASPCHAMPQRLQR